MCAIANKILSNQNRTVVLIDDLSANSIQKTDNNPVWNRIRSKAIKPSNLRNSVERNLKTVKMVEGDCVNENLIDDRKSGAVKLQIVPSQPKTLTHLPKRPPVDLAFHDLVYSVREGRRNRKYFSMFFLFQI